MLGERGHDRRRVLPRNLDEHREGLWRSTSVATRIVRSGRRSPSQWPGTARSSASAGRSRMETISSMCPCRSWPCRLGVTHLPRGTELRRQFLLQHAACLNKETAIESLRETSACLRRSGTAASASRRSAPATTEVQASVPHAIVAPHGMPATRLAAQRPLPRAPVGPVCQVSLPSRRCVKISRLTLDGDRRRPRAIPRTDWPAAMPREISSRSSSLGAATALRRGAGAIPPWTTTIRWTPVLFLLSSAREMANTLCPFFQRSHSSAFWLRREPNP